MKNSTVFDCSILELDKNSHEKGNISIIENGKEVPFNINRVYYLYDVPGGEDRGAHGHKELKQLIIAASGSFDLILNDGNNKRKIRKVVKFNLNIKNELILLSQKIHLYHEFLF